MYKTLGIVIIVLALVMGIVPQLTDCLSQGLTLTTTNGKTVPMKCHWTSIAELGVAIPLGLVGGLNLFGRRKETRRTAGMFGVTLGILGILFPTVLIGVCANPDMLCNMIEKPTLIFAGALVTAVSLVGILLSRRGEEPGA